MLHIDSIPGDKSISHRAVIIGSLVHGDSVFDGFLTSHDCLSTLAIFRDLGVNIELKETTLIVRGRGVKGLAPPRNRLDVGNSGTAIRLISGVLCALPFESTITGDASIQKRPMKRIIDPLSTLGARIESSGDHPPLRIHGQSNLKSGWHYTMPVASAQVKSSILLAAITAGVTVSIQEPEACRDHTERMLRLFGADLVSENGRVELISAQLHPPKDRIQIPGDMSSALFFICLGLMTKTPMVFSNIGLNPSRTGCLDVLRRMGANIQIKKMDDTFEPMGDIIVQPSDELKNIEVPLDLVANVIDELPILALLATTASGVMKVCGAEELRVKESDRIDGICRLISSLGADVVEFDDGFEITGPVHPKKKVSFDAMFDHRLAMTAFIAKKAFGIDIDINGSNSIPTSFPNFLNLIDQIM